jgi:hypothetical protein
MSKLKKLTSILLSLLLLVSVFTIVPFSAEAWGTSGDFEYNELPDNEASIIEYNGTKTDVVIPSEVNGMKVTMVSVSFEDCGTAVKSVSIPETVTEIYTTVFCGCKKLSNISVDSNNSAYCSVDGNLYNKDKTELLNYAIGKTDKSFTIPDSVKAIGEYAFDRSENLESIAIGNNVTEIKESAFNSCKKLKSIDIPDSVVTIGRFVFEACYGLTSAKLGKGVKSIGFDAFSSCESLSEINIPDSVKSIGDSAFYGCISLSSIDIPAGVESIGEAPFNACESLVSINVDSNNSNYCSIDGNLFTKDKSKLVQYAIGKEDKKYTIPDGVKIIGNCSFNWCSNIEEVVIPEGVTEIEDGAFCNCVNLAKINFPESLGKVGDDALSDTAFYHDEKNHENGALYAGKTLVAVDSSVSGAFSVKDGTVFISPSAFSDCENLTSVTIPDGVEGIGRGAFYGCSNLTEINMPDSCTEIEDYVFLNTAYYNNDSNWENNQLYIGKILIEDRNYYDYYDNNSATVKDGTVSIASGAYHNLGFTKITIPASVIYIHEWAFLGLSSDLEDVYYGGSKADWQKANKSTDWLKGVNVHFGKTDPAETDPVVTEPVTAEPVATQPQDTTPVSTEPQGTTPVSTEPQGTIPVVTEPQDTTPAVTTPDITVPVVTDPVATTPDVTQPPVTAPVVEPTQPSVPKPTLPKVTSKKTNPIKVTVKTKTVKLKKLKKKAQKVKAITVKGAQGKVTYKLVKSGITKKIRKLVSVNSKGVITIKKWKKAKKGTYKIKVTVKAAGTSDYNAKTITKTIKVKIK